MKIVINCQPGLGYSLSEAAYNYLGIPWDDRGYALDIPRDDARLVECIEALGEAAFGDDAELKVVEIPDDVKWYIEETCHDGQEYIVEEHRFWG